METLKDYNLKRRRIFDEVEEENQPHPNGIECPKCGAELWDSSPNIVLTSNPPQKHIHCPKCGYKGYALI